MRKKGLCLVMTDKCNAQCDICCFSCKPENNNVMSEDMMFDIIRQAKETENIEQICFSGGEPFLYFDLLKKGITFAHELGFATLIATNGFWGGWDDEILKERFSSFPVDKISFSYDAYHREYISEESFQRALSVCKTMKISYSVGIGETKGDKSANSFFKSLGDFKYLMDYYIYPFMRAGRAEKYPDDMFYKYVSSENLRCNDEGLLAVMYDGNVYPCCMQTVFSTKLILGNVKQNKLSDILKSSEIVRAFEVLRNSSCFSQLSKIAADNLLIERSENCVQSCEICKLMFQSSDNLKKLMPYIDQMYDKMIVDNLLGRKDGGLS